MSDATAKKRGLPMQVKMRHEPHFVEELTVRHAEPVGKMVPLSAIEPDPNQPRSNMGDLDDLARSIRDKGVLEPILVRPLDGPGGDRAAGSKVSYRIISGERRYHGAQKAGLYEVPVIEMDVGEDEALEIALVENLQRKDLTPFEECEGYRALGERFDYTHERIAEAVGKSRTVITESLSLLQMSPRVRDVVNALEITSKSVLLEVMKSTRTDDEAIELLERVAALGLSRDDLRRRARQRGPRSRGSERKKPYVFKFRAPDKTYNLSLSFRKSTVEREDLIAALEQILGELRSARS